MRKVWGQERRFCYLMLEVCDFVISKEKGEKE